jgi:CheY-like chemotaxis protein
MFDLRRMNPQLSSWYTATNMPLNPASSGSSQTQTVLCVDDEAIGLSVRRILLEREGYRVLTASNGIEGLRIFHQNSIDVVVLDYSMPGMDGGQVAAAMREFNPTVPILLLSAYVSLPDEVLKHVDRYLTKGDGAVSLLEALRLLVPRPA